MASAEDGTVVTRAYTGKTRRVLRNDWTQHFDELPRGGRAHSQPRSSRWPPAPTTSAPPTARRSTCGASSSPPARALGAIGLLVRAKTWSTCIVATPSTPSPLTEAHGDERDQRVRRTGPGLTRSYDPAALHRDPQRLGGATPTGRPAGTWRRPSAGCPPGGNPADRRAHGRRPPDRRATPLIVAEVRDDAGARRSHGAAYGHLDKQPGDTGWGRRPPPLDPGPRWRSAVRLQRRRRRLPPPSRRCWPSRSPRRRPSTPACRADRGERGVRRPRPFPPTSRPSPTSSAGLILVICLDSWAADTDGCGPRRRCAASPAGRSVEVLTEGSTRRASGIVPSSFRIIRQLLDRVEDAATGEVALRRPRRDPRRPPRRGEGDGRRARPPAAELFLFAGSTGPMSMTPSSRSSPAPGGRPSATWGPRVPTDGRAGNVLRPSTALALSMRCPPTCDPDAASMRPPALTADPPPARPCRSTTRRRLRGGAPASFAPWLCRRPRRGVDSGLRRPARTIGEGGTIPFMGMLGAMFPRPSSSSPACSSPAATPMAPTSSSTSTARRVTECVARLLAAHAAASPALDDRRGTPTKKMCPSQMSWEKPRWPSRARDFGARVVGRRADTSQPPALVEGGPSAAALGVGVVVIDLVVTAGHTVEGDLRVLSVDGQPARVVLIDRRTDLALVSADSHRAQPPTPAGDP